MIDDMLPEPAPSGALVPPPRNPPTALATADALPPYDQRRLLPTPVGTLGRMVEAALDTLDEVGDRIARAAGLR
jgi:hypothetical protein